MEEVKRERGHPTDYDPKYCQELTDFFSVEPYKEVEVRIVMANGHEKYDTKQLPNPIPFFAAFARKIGVSYQTLLNWTREHEEFFDAYNDAKQLQKELLIINGTNGLYNAPFAIFTAKNITDMRDQQDFKHSGSIGSKEVGKEEAALLLKEFIDQNKPSDPSDPDRLGDVSEAG